MALIDDRGRLFGRINLVDFALIAVAILLVPLGYGAYLLFRTPAPQLLGVSPNPMVVKKGEQRVHLTGEHLRPFLRATIGKNDARGFLIESPTSAEVVFDEMTPGTYDVALFDPSEEIARLPNALTIVPPPAPPVQFVGRFVGGNAADTKLFAGAQFGDPAHPAAEILDIKPAAKGERAATLRGSCEGAASPCVLAGTPIVLGKPTPLRPAKGGDAFSFVVDEIRVDGTWLEVHVRLFGIAEVLDLLRVGDVDRFNEPDTADSGVSHGAVIASLDASQTTDGAYGLSFTQGLPDASGFGGNISNQGHVPLRMRGAVLRIPLTKTERGWKYRDEFIRAGSGVAFETPDYFVRGMILRVVQPEPARERADQ